jgi:hypothetical protein
MGTGTFLFRLFRAGRNGVFLGSRFSEIQPGNPFKYVARTVRSLLQFDFGD